MTCQNAMEWRKAAGFPDYEVSEYGDVRRTRDKTTRRAGSLAKCYVNVDGYLAVTLCVRGEMKHVLVHRLVAITFIGESPSPLHLEVAHRNGSRLANHFSNLRWSTRAENHADIQAHGTHLKGMANGRAKLTDDEIRSIRREYREIKAPGSGRSPAELEGRYGVHRATIVNIAMGRAWRHVR